MLSGIFVLPLLTGTGTEDIKKKVDNKTRCLFLAPNSSVFIELKNCVDSFSYVYIPAVDLHLLALLYLNHICNPG